MHRVRIGLTGLGFVFIAVLLATALLGEPENERPITSNTANGAVVVDGASAAPDEPLAELGVAPRADVNAAEPANEAASSQR